MTQDEKVQDFIERVGFDFPRRDWLPFDSVWGDEA